MSESYRDIGELRWFLCWHGASYAPDTAEAGETLLAASHSSSAGASPGNGTRLSALLDGDRVRYIEVERLEPSE